MHRAIVLVALGSMALAGCGGGASLLSDEPTEKPRAIPVAELGMEGRWVLAAPNAPTCGLMFTGAPAATEGRVAPEGGCPERFFLARRWRLTDGTLTVIDADASALGSFRVNGDRFEGRSAAETAISLSR